MRKTDEDLSNAKVQGNER